MPALKDLTPHEVKADVDAGRIALIDVREPQEFGGERIHGALNFPLSTFDPMALPVGGPRRLVMQCGSGKRSADAVARCVAAGVEVDFHLAGGLQAWKAAGLATITVDPATGRVIDAR